MARKATSRQLRYISDLIDQVGERTGQDPTDVRDSLGLVEHTPWGPKSRDIQYASTASEIIERLRAMRESGPPISGVRGAMRAQDDPKFVGYLRRKYWAGVREGMRRHVNQGESPFDLETYDASLPEHARIIGMRHGWSYQRGLPEDHPSPGDWMSYKAAYLGKVVESTPGPSEPAPPTERLPRNESPQPSAQRVVVAARTPATGRRPPPGFTCGRPTEDGTACRNPVKNQGEPCHTHPR